MAQSVIKTLRGILGIETVPVSHAERIVSAVGGFAGILGIFLVTNLYVSGNSDALIVGSMCASAVLVFWRPARSTVAALGGIRRPHGVHGHRCQLR